MRPETNDDCKYPRVRLCCTSIRDWNPAVDGTHKVVPADAIVIERSELLAVSMNPLGNAQCGELICAPENADYARRAAIEWLSVSEHLREHPPVDEAEVSRICTVLAATDGTGSLDTRSRALYARGVRVTEGGRP